MFLGVFFGGLNTRKQVFVRVVDVFFGRVCEKTKVSGGSFWVRRFFWGFALVYVGL